MTTATVAAPPALRPVAPRIAENDTGPSVSAPLRGLEHLGKLAVFGRDALRALAAAPVAYAWRDIAVAGTVTLIAGPPAEGKTTLLFLLLAARLTTGDPVTLLGRVVTPAPAGQYVVLIEGEHSEGSTARKMLRMMALLGVDDVALDRLIVVARKAVKLGSPAWLDVVKLTKAGLVSDIALDTIARVAPGDANDEREQVAIFDIVAQAIESAPDGGDEKPSAWAVAHTRKGEAASLEDVSGSAQRVGQADTVALVKGEKVDGRTVSTTVTFAKLREDPDVYPLPVTFAIVKDDDGARLETGGKDEDGRPLEVRILEQLAAGPKTKTGIVKALHRNLRDVEPAITALFAARRIRSAEVKTRTGAYRGFELSPTPSREGIHEGIQTNLE